MCSGSRRRCGCARAGAGTLAGVVAAQATATQCGESRGGQRGVGKAAARQRGTRGMAESGAEAAGRRIGQRNRGGRGKVDEGGLNCNFQETQDSTVMSK
jgi:hypothetical protein